jgi:hypothetical protein
METINSNETPKRCLEHQKPGATSFDGHRIVQLGVQSRDFKVKEAAAFIEFLHAFGAQHGVKFEEVLRCS